MNFWHGSCLNLLYERVGGRKNGLSAQLKCRPSMQIFWLISIATIAWLEGNKIMRIKSIAITLFSAAIGMFGSLSAQGSIIQLGFLIDDSGSIGSGNFSTMKSGIASAFNNVMPTDGSVEVSIVKFSTTAVTVVSPTVVDSAAALNSIVTAINGMGYTGGGTCMSCGINSLNTLVSGSNNYDPSFKQVYNIATDGVPNSTSATITARNAAIALGLDEFDAEFIGSVGSSGYNFLLNSLVYPQPGHLAPPYTPGFVVPVTFANFESAFTAKLGAITGNVPEPATLALLGIGLVGLGAMRLRHKA